MQAYILEKPSEGVDVPESLRTLVWDSEEEDWYLSAYMLGLTHEQISAPILDGKTVTAFAKDNDVVLFSTNYMLDENLFNEEQRKELPGFLEKLGNPNND